MVAFAPGPFTAVFTAAATACNNESKNDKELTAAPLRAVVTPGFAHAAP